MIRTDDSASGMQWEESIKGVAVDLANFRLPDRRKYPCWRGNAAQVAESSRPPGMYRNRKFLSSG